MKKVSQATQEAHVRQTDRLWELVETWVKKNGGTVIPGNEWLTYDASVETPFGTLYLTVPRVRNTEGSTLVDGLIRTNGGLTVFGRFKEPELARAGGIDCNPFSGKWNRHYGARNDVDFVFADWEQAANRIVQKTRS